MYIENLRLPNEDEPTVVEAIQGCQDPDIFARVDDITQVVRTAVKPIRAKIGSFDMDQQLTSSQPNSNCYGSNLVLSEALQLSNINHLVAFANDHVFNIVTDSANYAYLADAHTPEFNGDITKGISISELKLTKDSIVNHRRAVLKLDTSVVIGNSRIDSNKHNLLQINPWISHASEAQKLDPRLIDIPTGSQHTILMASVYEPELGRYVIGKRSQLRQNIVAGELEAAAKDLHDLAGIYPEIDNRNMEPANLIGGIALSLALAGNEEASKQVIEDMAASFSVVNNLRLKLWPADQLRKIGFIIKNPDMIQESIKIYQNLLQSRPNNQLLVGKILAAKKRLSLLAN